MQLFKHCKASFVKTAITPKDYPKLVNKSGASLPEIAVLGRSNVGKSTLLNNLFNTKDLVKTSSTPGKTQALNYFIVDQQVVFVDLPGFGYAKVPESMSRQWSKMVETYVSTREELKLLLLLFDLRRGLQKEEHKLLEWLKQESKQVILIGTKADLLNQKELHSQLKEIEPFIELYHYPFVPYSSKKGLGRRHLVAFIEPYTKMDSP